jgi:hypothetical protein
MITQFEEKGKIFTQKVTKDQKEVIIQTISNQITGIIYIQVDNRLIDELNGPNQFIAITDAKIMDQNNKVLYRSEFLTINVSQIIWVLPIEDTIE